MSSRTSPLACGSLWFCPAPRASMVVGLPEQMRYRAGWYPVVSKEKHLPFSLYLHYTLFGPQMIPRLLVPHLSKDSLVKTAALAFALYLLYP